MLAVSSALVMAGCASTQVTNPMVQDSGLNVEVAKVISRPNEFGIKTIAESAQSEAVSTRILGIRVQGRDISLSAPVVGLSSRSAAQSDALANILESNPKIDGLIITQSRSEKTEFPPYIPILFSREKVRVKATPFVLENYGTVSEERADRIRAGASCETTPEPEKLGLFGRITEAAKSAFVPLLVIGGIASIL